MSRPEILDDEIFQQQCREYGYAIYQIGDRLVRVYCKPPDKRPLTDETPGQQPSPYLGMQPGTDPRYEMSAQDNLERDRNRSKAIMRRLLITKSKPLDEETQKAVNKIVKNGFYMLIEENSP